MWQVLLKATVVSIVSCAMALPAWADGLIARAHFATDVIDREPIDDIGSTVEVKYAAIQRVYFFTDLREMAGSQVIHRWKLDGEQQADVVFEINGQRWRVWSSKRLMPGFTGTWSVEVIRDGEVLETHSFEYVEASEEPT